MVFVTLSNENSSKLLINRDFKENENYPHKYNCLMPLHTPLNAVGLCRLEFMEFQAPFIGHHLLQGPNGESRTNSITFNDSVGTSIDLTTNWLYKYQMYTFTDSANKFTFWNDFNTVVVDIDDGEGTPTLVQMNTLIHLRVIEHYGSHNLVDISNDKVFEGDLTNGHFVLENTSGFDIILSGPWLKLLGIYNGETVTIPFEDKITVYPTFDVLNVINVHTTFSRGVYADNRTTNGLVPTNIMATIVNQSYGGEASLFQNFNASGMIGFNIPTLENFYVHFTDKWGDDVDLWSYVIGFEFLVSERTPVPQPETIYRARQKIMDIS